MERIKQFMERAQDRGASLVEYALLVALITVVCVGAVTTLGGSTSDAHGDAATGLGGAPTGTCHEWEHPGTGDSSHGRDESAPGCYENGIHLYNHGFLDAP